MNKKTIKNYIYNLIQQVYSFGKRHTWRINSNNENLTK